MKSDREVWPGMGGPCAKAWVRGTHRQVSPEQTEQRLATLLAPLGITRIAHITGLDVIGIPVVVACRPNSRSLAVSQGKGLTLAAARVSAVMETMELYHAERITRPLKLASFDEMRFTHSMIDIDGLPRLGVSRFHPKLSTMWIEGFDLLRQAPTWLPYETVHMNYTLPLPPGSGSFLMSSNGLASGNHVLEALSHGLCEVVERDCDSLWVAASSEAREATRLDLATIDDEDCRGLLDLYAAANVDVAVWETTSDTGIAAYRCAILDKKPDPARALMGTVGLGCHPARRIALVRALTEAAQSRLTVISSSRDDITREDYEASRFPDMLARIHKLITGKSGTRSFHSAPDFEGATFDDDLRWLLGRLQSVGLDSVVAVDLTQPGLDVSVVRTVIPGLEPAHMVPGYQPGRRAQNVSG